MKLFTVLLTITVILLASCGGKEAQELKDTMDAFDAVSKLADAGEKMEEHTAIAEKRMAERKAKGDTIALHFEKLQEYLPASVSGYTAEEPYGQSFNAMGMSYSEASRKFVKTNSDGSQNFIEVKIIDYNESYHIYSGLTAWVSAGISVENSDGFERGYKTDIDYAYGWEKYSKQTKDASVLIAVGFRFLVTIEANNQNGTDDLKKIANSINLKKLANM